MLYCWKSDLHIVNIVIRIGHLLHLVVLLRGIGLLVTLHHCKLACGTCSRFPDVGLMIILSPLLSCRRFPPPQSAPIKLRSQTSPGPWDGTDEPRKAITGLESQGQLIKEPGKDDSPLREPGSWAGQPGEGRARDGELGARCHVEDRGLTGLGARERRHRW